MRWATPDGRTVHPVTLEGTPAPSRPGDPAKHIRARDYLIRTGPGGRDRWFIPVPEFGKDNEHKTKAEAHTAAITELAALAEREAWDVGQLAQMPTYVVADTFGGEHTRGADGELFTRDTAAEFAAKRNAGMAEGNERAHRVYALADITDQVLEGGTT